MTQAETRLIEMLRRVLKGFMLGVEYMPKQYEISDLLEEVRDAIERRDKEQVTQAQRFCEELSKRKAAEDLKLAELRREAYEGISQVYSGLVDDLDKIADDLRKGKT